MAMKSHRRLFKYGACLEGVSGRHSDLVPVSAYDPWKVQPQLPKAEKRLRKRTAVPPETVLLEGLQ